LALYFVAAKKTVLTVLRYGCGSFFCASRLKPKQQVLIDKPIERLKYNL